MLAWSTAAPKSSLAAAARLESISRSTSSGPTRAIAETQARTTAATVRPKRRPSAFELCLAPRIGGDLAAACGDNDAAGEEEERAEPGDFPEPVEGRPDRKGEHRGQQCGVAIALWLRGVAPGGEGAPEQGADQAEYEQPADDAQLGERLEVEGVRVVHR